MEKDLSSPPSAVTTQGSCPVLDGSSCPPTAQIPPSPASAAPSQRNKSTSSSESKKSSPPPSTQTKPMDSPPSSDKSKPFSPKPTSTTVLTKPPVPAPNKTPLTATPNTSTPQIPKTSSFSKLKSASFASSCSTDSPPPSPTTLGQHYLIVAEEKDTESNNRVAVNWLIKAAKQGRKGAARLLQRCWIQKKGITLENEADVRKLSTESKFELAVRKAAMMMYWKLNPDRKTKVAVSEMLGNVSQVQAVPARQLVDLDDFVEMTKKYAQGLVPSSPQSGNQVTAKTERAAPHDHGRETWENFSALTSLLTRFEPGLDVEQAETNFGWNNLEPYLYFILSVFFVIFSFPVADKNWIPCSELSTVAVFFTAVSFQSLSPTAATYARRAMAIEVASSLCCLTHFLPEHMTVLRLLGHTFSTLPLGESVVLKLSLPCLLYLYLFYLFFSMAKMRGFRGIYCFLVPYLVCFMWCEFSVVLLQNSTPVGLIRTCVAYFLFLFALPVLAFGLATMLFIQIFKWFLELELTKVIVTLVVCAIPVTLRLWTRFSMSILDVFRSLTHRGPVKLILLCISMVILFFSVYVYHAEGQKVYNSTLTWNQYSQACGPPAWETKGMAQTQIFCSHLHGHRVTWAGRFKHVRVAETENGAQSVINMLPVFMGDWLRCLYGETYPKCEPKNATVEDELCQIKTLAKHTCHVKRFDSYRFEVTVGMIRDGSGETEDPARDMILMASHEFRQVLLNLSPGHMVEFSTKLEGRLGAKAPAFELKAIHCLDCASSLLTGGRQVKIERDWRRTTMRALKFAFDFFFSPFLSAKITA
uniref:Wolfram syndrome 1a (wolframin) n=1 Tax=Acanthochromis polyacanthus TaxID=80966 RepID=A0A3Q1HY42_9TELE